MAAARRRRHAAGPVMHGREREQARLRALLSDLLAGQGGLVLLSGEAGIGKTTLVADLVRQAAAQGCLVLTGGCYDLTTTPPYGPWLELLRAYPAGAGGSAVPAWFEHPEALEQLGSQAALFAEARRFLTEVARQQPLLLVLEDLHWADPASLDALRALSRQLEEVPLLLVATYRDDELTRHDRLYQLLPALVREAGAVRITLARLDEPALRALIAGAYALAADDLARLTTYVAGLSEGNPLYAAELLFTLEAHGVLGNVAGRHTLGALVGVSVPPLLQQVIERRLERLAPEATALLEVAAVLGQEFAFATWVAVSEAEEAALLAALAAGQHDRILEEVGREGRYRFHHALTRETLYERQLWPRRRDLHRRVGDLLSQQPHPDPDTVAYHFQAAGDERAVEWLIRAGERATWTYAWMIAVEHYTSAVRLLEPRADSAHQRAELLDAIALLYGYEDPRRGVGFADEALRLASETEDDALLVRVRVHRGMLRCYSGQVRDGITEMQLALDAEEHTSERTAAPRASARLTIAHAVVPHDMLGYWLDNAGHFQAALALWERQRAQRSEPGTAWLVGKARASAMLGRVEAAQREFRELRRRAEAGNFHIARAAAIQSEFCYFHIPYDTDNLAARHELQTRGAQAQSASAVFLMALIPDFVILDYFDVDWHAWFSQLERDIDFGNSFWAHYSRAQLARLAYYRGTLDVAWQQVAALFPEGAATHPGDCNFLAGADLQLVAADLCLDAGDLAGAIAWLAAHDRWLAWAGAVRGQAEGQLGWACYHRVAGQEAPARHHAEQALARAEQPRQPLALLAAQRLLGQLAVDAGRCEEANEHLTAALALAERCQAPFEQALTLLVLAERAVQLGECDDARRLLGQVRTICEPLGATPTLRRADEIAARLPQRRASSDTYPAGLTAREVEVLRLVVAGLTDAEVGAQLFISPRTVSTHLTSIYSKLGVSSRVDATRVVVERRLV